MLLLPRPSQRAAGDARTKLAVKLITWMRCGGAPRSLLLYLLKGIERPREREILFFFFFYNFRVGVFTSRMETESRVGE